LIAPAHNNTALMKHQDDDPLVFSRSVNSATSVSPDGPAQDSNLRPSPESVRPAARSTRAAGRAAERSPTGERRVSRWASSSALSFSLT